MKSYFISSLFVVLSFSGVSSSLAQISLRSVLLDAQAEAGYLIDGRIDWVVETDTNGDFSEPEVRADVFRGSGTCFAGQNVLVAASGDSVVFDGIALTGGSRQESGTRLYLRSWTTANGVADIGEGCSYRFSGHRSQDAHVSLYLVNWNTGDEVSVAVPVGSADFEYSGPLPGAGTYKFQVALEFLHVSSETSDLQEELSYNFVMYPSGSVANELSSWGAVKSLYR